jgi:polyvinyl alcohol dehydrogenase (cytochrome)
MSVGKPLAVLCAAAMTFIASLALASPPQRGGTTTTTGATAADGASLFKARCASCHEGGNDRAPNREVLSHNAPSFIVSTLRNGAMGAMAAGLTPAEIVAIAQFVSKAGKGSSATPQDIDPKTIWGDGVAGTPLDAPLCAKPPRPVDLSSRAQWNGWSVANDNARFQPRPGLTASQVPRLKLKWAMHYAGAKNGQATIVGDRLFTTSMSGAVYALDARSGCVHWRHAAEAATRTSVTVVTWPAGAPARHALFFSDWTKSAVALDADTGKLLWKTVIDDQPGEQMTGSPTYWDGKLFVPISSGLEAFAQAPQWQCCKFRGALVALDAVTGRILWKRYTTETAPHPFKVNSAGAQMWGPSGGAIWVAPTVDAARRLLYVATSNSYTDVPYDNADSVMAIDADSGRIRWVHQLTTGDNYIDGCWRTGGARPASCPSRVGPDFEIGASPILRDVPGGGQLLLVGQKSGLVYALDPATGGKLVWQRRVGYGSALGGIEFGFAADATRVYAGVSDIVATDRGHPGLVALDLRTGAILWHVDAPTKPTCRWKNFWCSGAISQAISVTPDAVYAGSYDGHFRAYDPRSGHILWDVDTGSEPIRTLDGKNAYGGVMDGAGPTIAGGMVYVHSGYAGRSGATGGRDMRNADGNLLLAFSVDGK